MHGVSPLGAQVRSTLGISRNPPSSTNTRRGKTIALGVIDTATAFVEHPEVVGDRLSRAATALGPEKVVACTDCGFGTWAGFLPNVAGADRREGGICGVAARRRPLDLPRFRGHSRTGVR